MTLTLKRSIYTHLKIMFKIPLLSANQLSVRPHMPEKLAATLQVLSTYSALIA